jgi:hypothetical protein
LKIITLQKSIFKIKKSTMMNLNVDMAMYTLQYSLCNAITPPKPQPEPLAQVLNDLGPGGPGLRGYALGEPSL